MAFWPTDIIPMAIYILIHFLEFRFGASSLHPFYLPSALYPSSVDLIPHPSFPSHDLNSGSRNSMAKNKNSKSRFRPRTDLLGSNTSSQARSGRPFLSLASGSQDATVLGCGVDDPTMSALFNVASGSSIARIDSGSTIAGIDSSHATLSLPVCAVRGNLLATLTRSGKLTQIEPAALSLKAARK